MRYFTKEWYELCQKYGATFGGEEKALQKQMNDGIVAFQQALARENLPEGLWEKFSFHDGVVRSVREETDYVIGIDSPFSPYHSVRFCNAAVKQDSIPVGAVWLYEELYRHYFGYEAHILCESDLGLRDTKIICSEILFEKAS